jgi:iron complex transport system substrate-binding protein
MDEYPLNHYGQVLFVVGIVTAAVFRTMKKAAEKVVTIAAKKIRVASVLPSATEILCSIGGDHLLVGRSHEDNFPLSITHLPALTGQLISREWTSASAVNAEVSCALASGKSLYFLNAKLLADLKPDLILTQDLCSVCAIDLAEVRLIASQMDPQPVVLSLNPQTLEDVLSDMIIVGEAVGMQKEAAAAKGVFDDRVRTVVSAADEILKEWEGLVAPQGKGRIKVAFIEWSDPIYVGGHWTPQLIYMAGGEHTLNPCGEGGPNSYVQIGGAGKSFPVTTESVIASDPDLIIVSPCGLNLEMSRREADRLMSQLWFQELRAVKNRRLLVVDGDAMFNRPGPRLVDALEWLVSVLHDAGDSKPTKSVAHAMSLQPKDFPFFDYFEKVSPVESEVVVADIKTSEELALVAIEEAHTGELV